MSPAVRGMAVRGGTLPLPICRPAPALLGGGRREMEKERRLETIASVSPVSSRGLVSPARTSASVPDDLKPAPRPLRLDVFQLRQGI